MAQNIALNVRTPQPNLAAITRAAQDANLMDHKLQNAPMQSELEALQMKDEIGERTALGGYRDAAGKGDPNALDKLSGYPELQKKMYETFDGMSREEFMEAKKRATAFAKAAQFVGKVDGTPEQEQRWTASAKVLKDAGYINDQQFNMMIEAGPSDLMMQQAMTADQWLKAYGGHKDKDDKDPEMKALDIEEKNARIAQIKASTKTPEQKQLEIDKIKAETEAKKTAKPGSKNTRMAEIELKVQADILTQAIENAAGDPAEIAAAEAKFAKARQEIMARFGLSNGEAPVDSPEDDPEAEDTSAGDPLQQARDAIAAGADPEAVKARLEENGIDASGL